MKAIIPAKYSSIRVPKKNWIDFDGDKCLVTVLIEKLVAAGFAPSDIYVSSESRYLMRRMITLHGVNELPRPKYLCENQTSLVTLIRSVCGLLGDCDEIAWAQCTSPTFNEYSKCLSLWQENKRNHDSLCVAYPGSPYSLVETKSGLAPHGWSFGENHQSSQQLCSSHTMPFAFSILTRESIESTGYYVGRRPFWYVASESHIDIDTMQDFRDAQAVYCARGMGDTAHQILK